MFKNLRAKRLKKLEEIGETEQSLGVEKLKNAINEIIDVGEEIDEALEDKRISLIEGGKLALKAPGLWKAVRDFPEIKKEIENASEEEINGLVDYFATEFDIRNDKVEELIEYTISIVVGFIGIGEVLKR